MAEGDGRPFQVDQVGAVGGYVDGYFDESALDRYEKTFSSLNMGRHILWGAADESTVYVPTCNLLVRKTVYHETGGIREDMHVGEDVDFCWRMRGKGFGLLYVPTGSVRHKHRNKLGNMLKRRADYGTSEAMRYTLHPDKGKRSGCRRRPQLPSSPSRRPRLRPPLLLFVPLGCLPAEACVKAARIRRLGLGVPFRRIFSSLLRSYFSFSYFVSFHLVRYYLAPLLVLGFLFHPAWRLSGFIVAVSSSVDYATKRPRLAFPVFLFYYVLDHLSYRTGVLAGCLRAGSFGSYKVRAARG